MLNVQPSNLSISAEAKMCLAKSRNLSIPTDVIFLDLAKALDSVDHERLLLKLKNNDINDFLFKVAQNSNISVRNQGAVSRNPRKLFGSVKP